MYYYLRLYNVEKPKYLNQDLEKIKLEKPIRHRLNLEPVLI